MGSADFSQFVVTTVNETVCETSTLKVRALSPHPPATFTGTSGNFWASSLLADLPVFPSLICGSCSSGQGFAYSFLQIPSRDGHPCCSAMYFVVTYAYSGLPPVRARPWRANQKKEGRAYSAAFCPDTRGCILKFHPINRSLCPPNLPKSKYTPFSSYTVSMSEYATSAISVFRPPRSSSRSTRTFPDS